MEQVQALAVEVPACRPRRSGLDLWVHGEIPAGKQRSGPGNAEGPRRERKPRNASEVSPHVGGPPFLSPPARGRSSPGLGVLRDENGGCVDMEHGKRAVLWCEER